ncbi:energy transducer TonB [Hymenobacter wooponensis]|uniref:Energy transducer TonB n=1 Tax=Hymenobacter wooponensis TaxID=1525360 RepID=A0A4Z0MQY5_9BACT|nr:energy transducer TonB [Hymenobacter wooponensis]TGD82243.1 energy transducer TonB [Hymenobacter wooponensis]
MSQPLRWILLLVSLTGSTWARAQSVSSTIVPDEAARADVETPSSPAAYYTAEIMPSFPGGEEAMRAFLRNKLQYPQEALNRRVGGKVFVSFLVTEEGRIRDAKIVKGLGAGLDEEALRLVRIMPWWNPGKNANQPVPVMYTLPIVFRGVY